MWRCCAVHEVRAPTGDRTIPGLGVRRAKSAHSSLRRQRACSSRRVPGTITVGMHLEPDPIGGVLDAQLTVEVSLPLFSGKVEKMIVDNVAKDNGG